MGYIALSWLSLKLLYKRSAERYLIEQTLRQVAGNKTKAAAMLGIHRTPLYQK
jgi:DNA-binding protein Fis